MDAKGKGEGGWGDDGMFYVESAKVMGGWMVWMVYDEAGRQAGRRLLCRLINWLN